MKTTTVLAIARGIGVAAPPQDAFAAGLVQRAGAAGHAEAHVDRGEPAGDVRIRAVEDAALRLVLVEALQQERLERVARLRDALRDSGAEGRVHGSRFYAGL